MKLYLFAIISISTSMCISSCKRDAVKPTATCTIDYADSSAEHPRGSRYQALIDKYTRKGLPGIVLLIRDNNGTWIGTSGKADIDKCIDMQPCTVSKVASITKMMVGVLLMKLVEEGTISLDDTVSKYLSEDELRGIANADKCTLRNLMNHTSGIYDVVKDSGFYLEVLNNPNQNWDYEKLLKYVRGKQPVFEVNSNARYSNTNQLLAVMIIDKATGRNHADVLREKLFAPLGMTHTYYYYHDALPPNVAQGYYDLYNNGSIMNLSNYNTASGNGFGGVYSTVKDLQLFIDALLRDKTLLKPASLATMLEQTPPDKEKHRSYGIGIFKDFLERDPLQYAYGHRGRDLAYSADLFYFPTYNTTMSFLINYGTDGQTNLKEVFSDFRSELADEICR